jgi:hypothetical protein
MNGLIELLLFAVGSVFAFLLLKLAYKYYGLKQYFFGTWIGLAGAVLMFCSMPWFQGFAKAFLNTSIISRIQSLGEQVNNVQTTTSEMHAKLELHQKEIQEIQLRLQGTEDNIVSHQSDIKIQQTSITNQFQQLAIIQTNLTVQARELSDVEYWVKNLYEKSHVETFSATTTNALWVNTANDFVVFIGLLEQIPIGSSIELYVKDDSNKLEQRAFKILSMRNLIFYGLKRYNTNSVSITARYTANSSATNCLRRLPILGEDIQFVDEKQFQWLSDYMNK